MKKLILAVFGTADESDASHHLKKPGGICRLIISDYKVNGNPPGTVSVILKTDRCNFIDHELIKELISEENQICIVASEEMKQTEFHELRTLNALNKTKKRRENASCLCMLTRKEREVMSYLSKGLQYKEIASELGVSYHTVKNHISNIYVNLDVNNVCEAFDRYRKEEADLRQSAED